MLKRPLEIPIRDQIVESEFQNLTYDQLFEEWENRIRLRPNLSPRYVSYLKDLIETIRRLSNPEARLDTKTSKFIFENWEEIERLKQASRNLQRDLWDRISEIEERIQSALPKLTKEFVGNPWHHRPARQPLAALVYEFSLIATSASPIRMFVDITAYTTRWEIVFLTRERERAVEAARLLDKKGLRRPEINGSYFPDARWQVPLKESDNIGRVSEAAVEFLDQLRLKFNPELSD